MTALAIFTYSFSDMVSFRYKSYISKQINGFAMLTSCFPSVVFGCGAFFLLFGCLVVFFFLNCL